MSIMMSTYVQPMSNLHIRAWFEINVWKHHVCCSFLLWHARVVLVSEIFISGRQPGESEGKKSIFSVKYTEINRGNPMYMPPRKLRRTPTPGESSKIPEE